MVTTTVPRGFDTVTPLLFLPLASVYVMLLAPLLAVSTVLQVAPLGTATVRLCPAFRLKAESAAGRATAYLPPVSPVGMVQARVNL